MGFVSGFAGGVTLTLSVAYLSALAHQRNRERQGQALRAQALELQTIIDPIPLPLPPTRSEVAAEQRAAKVEVLKEKWNDEVGRAVRWVQTTDWDEVRYGLQSQAGALWTRVTGGTTPVQSVEAVEGSAADRARSIEQSARGAFQKAKAEARSVEEAAQHKALEARLQAKKATKEVAEDAAAAAKEGARETGGVLSSLLGRGKEKAAELAGKAKEAVGLAAGGATAASAAIDGVTLTTGSSAVEKALHQRYQKTTARDTRTVAEVLKARYTPVDDRDNTNLRGL
ncbi:hypothetical protein ISF_05757 [Cordyceps fumosorosea ARSEF 2679]|uniref:MICOS complex subunit MIC12 n=1 Tax=Cordyceps fumosorosea (strain ARSEF 2679) TaxID=1081104 RepID=A0A167TLC8_CORFA|nr:hypothetical protein ISF_05757 [Cordyceps fumosorosea ARSEF 2679]OAA60718.1 hypothetical protein ISF_05757 [Cordyceps fumosorosea ARSEF 2679]